LGVIEDLKILGDGLNNYRTLVFDFIHPACNIELEEIEVEGKLLFLFDIDMEFK